MSSGGAGRDLSKLIARPFSHDTLSADASARVLLLAPPGDLQLPDGLTNDLLAVQGFRLDYLKLTQRGLNVVPDSAEIANDGSFDIVIVCLSRHRRWNEQMLSTAARVCAEGGTIVAAGGKTDGAGAIRKALSRLTDDLQSLPKHHGIVMWLRVDNAVRTALTAAFHPEEEPSAAGFVTAPGGFSAERVDAGSALLAQHLPSDLDGAVADFCAGWGYLSAAALKRCPALASLDLFEADWASLEAAKRNLTGTRAIIAYHWRDLAHEPVEGRFDTIVMNPPFHTGRAAEPALGAAIIERAASCLKPGGRLFLVANRQLPYEGVIDRRFATARLLAETPIYKVIEAARPVAARQ
ncbi:class I SAM-dependent methyltransferase [Notoacmeibacter marinus]|uniref:class I SAM-dependent methyltransferase n=1 Tax=Notoacmeibacter marinus TaxID=1876515 RepID=UPI000DF2A257|nr:class I SAM-dependent methyltransferase [Notoacmeibacter marinus]